jgi:hypothetical protein
MYGLVLTGYKRDKTEHGGSQQRLQYHPWTDKEPRTQKTLTHYYRVVAANTGKTLSYFLKLLFILRFPAGSEERP